MNIKKYEYHAALRDAEWIASAVSRCAIQSRHIPTFLAGCDANRLKAHQKSSDCVGHCAGQISAV